MFPILGWLLFGVLLWWYVFSVKYAHSRRCHLRSYLVYLLLDDNIREDHKEKFREWITQRHMSDASSLGYAAHNVIEIVAEKLANGNAPSLSAANALIWRVKQGGSTAHTS
jgi:hypothetical protein